MPEPLAPLVPEAADEGPHEHDDHVLWSESHYLDAVAPRIAYRIRRIWRRMVSHLFAGLDHHIKRHGRWLPLGKALISCHPIVRDVRYS